MILRLVPAHAFAVRHVIWTCRPWNFKELLVELGSGWRETAVRWVMEHPPWHFVVEQDDRPICVFGMVEFAKDHWSLYMVGTEAVEKCGRPLARLLKRTFREWAAKVQPVSAECKALKGNPKSPRWFKFLGAELARETERHEFYSFRGLPCASTVRSTKKPSKLPSGMKVAGRTKSQGLSAR